MDQLARFLPLSTLMGRPLDLAYSRLGGLNGTFFMGGWGDLGVVDLRDDLKVISAWPPPAPLRPDWRLVERGAWRGRGYRLFEAAFPTPCIERVYNALPPESRRARARLLLPDGHKAGVVHLAATGDQGWRRRLWLGWPMMAQGVATVVLESPFYGARRPSDQRGSKLRHVSDLLTLGWATIIESLHLLHWMGEEGCEAKGVCGLSMGGVHAAMAGGLYPLQDLSVAPMLAPRSAAVAYCDGAMRPLMAWDALSAAAPSSTAAVEEAVARAAQAVSLLREASRALAALEDVRAAQQRSLGAAAAPDAAATAAAGEKAAAGALAAAERLDAALRDALLPLLARRRGGGRAAAEAASGPALDRLRAVLETFTDVARYPPPRRPDAAVIVAAEADAYVSQDSVRALHAHWRGSELRLVSGGHVSAFLMHQGAFRRALGDGLSRLGLGDFAAPGEGSGSGSAVKRNTDARPFDPCEHRPSP